MITLVFGKRESSFSFNGVIGFWGFDGVCDVDACLQDVLDVLGRKAGFLEEGNCCFEVIWVGGTVKILGGVGGDYLVYHDCLDFLRIKV